jgi:hypothetical protein
MQRSCASKGRRQLGEHSAHGVGEPDDGGKKIIRVAINSIPSISTPAGVGRLIHWHPGAFPDKATK